MVYVVDAHPLKWLCITRNTVEEPGPHRRAGRTVGAVMEDARWMDDGKPEITVRPGIRFQDVKDCTAHSV